jgi:hypothetical protein
MVRVFGIGEGSEQSVEAWDAVAIFGRSVSFAAD